MRRHQALAMPANQPDPQVVILGRRAASCWPRCSARQECRLRPSIPTRSRCARRGSRERRYHGDDGARSSNAGVATPSGSWSW
jgi:hypothetical protein